MGCCKFWNDKHLLQVSRDGKWMDGGESPASLGSYATIHKAKSGGLKSNILMWFIWILLLAIASLLAVSSMHSSLLIVQQGTTGLLVLRISCQMPSLPPSGCFVLWLVPLLNAFIVTVTSSSLALPSASTSLTMTPKLLQHRPSINCPTVWSSHIGRSWFIWDVLTSPKSKCHGLSGSM
jgi:hypothetical protein